MELVLATLKIMKFNTCLFKPGLNPWQIHGRLNFEVQINC